MRRLCLFVLWCLAACGPVSSLQLRQIRNVQAELGSSPLLRAEAVIHNPNRMRVKLRKADIEVHIDNKPAAYIQQHFNLTIPPRADFSLPLEVKVNLEEMGLLNTVLSVLGGKKFEVQYTGTLWLSYHGMRIKLPVNHREEVRIRL
jgi:LEA14-like dessication related protein